MNKKFFKKITGKGYYIALILCAAAIGISGYLYYRNANQQDPAMSQEPSATQSDDVQAVATQPTTTTEPTEDNTEKTIKTASPLSGETVSVHAVDCLSYNQTTRDWRVHDGIDITASAGTAVCAAADGTVYTVYDDETMGKTVVIRHDGGYTTSYSSLGNDVSVATGQAVQIGQPIGTVGNTALMETAIGDHLHFSVSHNGAPMDPEEFFNLE